MANPVTDLRVRISADLQGFNTGIRSMRSSLTGLKSVLAGALAGVSVGAFARAVIKSTAESEAALAQLEARLKSTGGAAGLAKDELVKMASGLQAVTAYGDEAIIGAESLLLTFTKIGRDVFPQALEAVLDMSTALGQDLKSSALQLGKALNDPILGVTALGRAGVQFTADQKKVIESLVQTGRTAEAQKIILGELETQMGGAARAARGTLSGAFQALKEAAGDLLEGDSGGGGVKGVRDALESMIATLNDPSVKRGAAATVAGLLAVAGAAIKVTAWVGNAGTALAEYFGKAAARSSTMLKNQRNELEGQLFAAQRNAGRGGKLVAATIGLPGVGTALGAAGGLIAARDLANIENLKQKIAEIDAILDKRSKQAADDFAKFRGLPENTGLNVNPNGVPPATPAAPHDAGGTAAKKTKDNTAAIRENILAVNDLTAAEIDHEQTQTAWLDRIDDLAAQMQGPLAEALREYTLRVREVNAAEAKGEISAQKASDARQLYAEQYRQAAESIQASTQDIEESQGRLSDAIEGTAFNALSGFLYDLASGAKSFKDSFLDMVRSFVAGIAQMIAQQLALKAVQGLMGSFGFGGAGSVLHGGGIVGNGGTIRNGLNPVLMGYAPRYHGGGIAGLAPGEVAAVLKRGEEVLTANDPRHVRNGGGASGTLVKQPIVAIGDRAVADALRGADGEQVIITHVRNNWTGLTRGGR